MSGPSETTGQPAARPPSRSEAKDAAARAALKPLAPGERPLAVTVAAVGALLLAVINASSYVAGWEIAGQRPQLVNVAAPVLLLLLLAGGMWRMSYWAVLATQVVLAMLVCLFTMLAMFAQNWRSVAVAVLIVVPASVLFWKLIKVMARIQMRSRS